LIHFYKRGPENVVHISFIRVARLLNS